MAEILFSNREDAARKLAGKLAEMPLTDPVVLAIPRGGVVIGAILARSLGAELDVVLARKLRAPGQPELAIGAISEDGEIYLDPIAGQLGGVSEHYLARERAERLAEIDARRAMVRAIRPPAAVENRSVILTDDGIATGSTMLAAIQVVRSQNAREVIVAVPVAPPDRLAEIARRSDRVVCLSTPPGFVAIGQFYVDFEQVSDEEAQALLRELYPGTPPSGAA